MRKLVFLTFLLFSFSSWSISEIEAEKLRTIKSPWFEGDTLYFRGPVDSHFYNTLSYDAEKLKSIKVVDISSFGGNLDWALQVAEKLKALNITTRIARDQVCASACVVLFAAGQERIIHPSAWIGVHAARVNASASINLNAACHDQRGDKWVFNEYRETCQLALAEYLPSVLEMTDKMFAFLEDNGVEPELKEDYFHLPLRDDWFQAGNLLRTADWVLSPEEALRYNLATSLISD